MPFRTTAFALLLIAASTACPGGPRSFDTAGEVADALRDAGVAWEQSEPLDFSGMAHAKIDEGLKLTADGLHVEVVRITDERTYRVMGAALAIGRAVGAEIDQAEAEDGEERPLRLLGNRSVGKLLKSRPYVIVIRAEPVEGATAAIVRELLPADPR